METLAHAIIIQEMFKNSTSEMVPMRMLLSNSGVGIPLQVLTRDSTTLDGLVDRVPLNPLVNHQFPYEKWSFHGYIRYTTFADRPKSSQILAFCCYSSCFNAGCWNKKPRPDGGRPWNPWIRLAAVLTQQRGCEVCCGAWRMKGTSWGWKLSIPGRLGGTG